MFKKFIIYWLPIVFWAALIFWFSDQPYLKSDLPGPWDFALRKTAHFTEYFVLTWLLIRAFLSNQPAKTISPKKIIFLAGFLSILYALTDEYHQSFIPGRQPALRDIGFDSLGAVLAAWLKYIKMIKYK